jgi:hypothetical protein
MPTYRNTQSNSVTYNEQRFIPGKDIPVGFFVPPELGFVKVSDEPVIRSPLLWSGTLTDTTFYIPAAGKITISSVTDTTCKIFVADDTQGTLITSAYGDNTTAQWSRIGKIRVEGSAYVKIWREEE